MNSIRRIAGIAVALCLAASLGTVARAEVGVVIHVGGGVSSYLEQGIVDDPDPISSAWIRHHPAGGIRIVLNEDGAANGDGEPSLVVHPASGLPIVAWARNAPGGYDVVISRFDGVMWTFPQIVADEAADALDPYLAIDPDDGSIHLVYWVHGTVPRVMHRQAPADLSSWSTAVQVSHPADVACRPSAVVHEGVLQVAYEVHDPGYGATPRQIMLAVADGQAFASQILATTHHPDENRPQVHAGDGRLWVEWIDASADMAWTRRQLAGDWDSVQIEFFETPEQREFHIRGRIRALALQ